jgi:hypothetical protein
MGLLARQVKRCRAKPGNTTHQGINHSLGKSAGYCGIYRVASCLQDFNA